MSLLTAPVSPNFIESVKLKKPNYEREEEIKRHWGGSLPGTSPPPRFLRSRKPEPNNFHEGVTWNLFTILEVNVKGIKILSPSTLINLMN